MKRTALTLTDDEVRHVVDTYDKPYLDMVYAVYTKEKRAYCECSCCRMGRYIDTKKADTGADFERD